LWKQNTARRLTPGLELRESVCYLRLKIRESFVPSCAASFGQLDVISRYEMVRGVNQRDSGGPGGIRTHDSRIKSLTTAVLIRHF